MSTNFYKYIKNAFYIEDPKNELSVGDRYMYGDSKGKRISHLMSRYSFDNEEDFEAAIAFDHEITHYIQDLTLNACINDGLLTDYIMGGIKEASHIKGIIFPLPFDDELEFNKIISNVSSEEEKGTLNTLKLCNNIYRELFVNSFEDENFNNDYPHVALRFLL